jgi:hypothetical protein
LSGRRAGATVRTRDLIAQTTSPEECIVISPLALAWIAIVVIAAALLGIAAGTLAWLDDRRFAHAVLVGGGAAGGLFAVAIAAAALFTGLD